MAIDKVEYLNGMIEDLDKNREAEIAAQSEITGNNMQVHTDVAARQSAGIKYERERQRLINLRNEAMEVSSGVSDFISGGKKYESKLDVQEGRSKVDDSLNPLGGKKI
jgi:hypothetical protein